jgi:glycosyltransferase involved in cell wall biosynthesis
VNLSAGSETHGLRIAIVVDCCYPFTRGGREKRYYAVTKRLVASGHDVHMFVPKLWDGRESILRAGGVTFHGVCAPRFPRFVDGRRSLSFAAQFAAAVGPALARHACDVVDCDEIPFLHAFSARAVCAFRQTPMVMGWWETWDAGWEGYLGRLAGAARTVERWVAALPWWLVVETESNRRTLSAWGAQAGRISVIPSGVDFEHIRTVPPIDAGVDVLFVGRLVRQKGVHLLPSLVRRLWEGGTPLRFGILGEGPELEAVQRECRAAGVAGLVKFFGRVDNDDTVVGLMKGAKLLVYPAGMEGGWSLTALEAQACGVPVVTPRAGTLGTCECVIDGYNGLLAADETAAALTASLSAAARTPGLREKLGGNAIQFARRFDWDNQSRLVEEVYREALRSWHGFRSPQSTARQSGRRTGGTRA